MKISFSIITVSYNSKQNLITTINSIQRQTYKEFNHIIKDGLSRDKTNEINFNNYKNTFFYEGFDFGIYDAMNRALRFVQNEYILYLNAGDYFLSKNSLKELAETIKQNPNFDIYAGGTLQINPKSNLPLRVMGIGRFYKFFPLAQLPHPSFIIKKSTLSKLKNPFDGKLKIAGDYKQQLILRKNNLWNIYYVNKVISVMPIGGVSNNSASSRITGFKETLLFSLNIYGIIAIYIIGIKLLLNIYSKFKINFSKKYIIL